MNCQLDIFQEEVKIDDWVAFSGNVIHHAGKYSTKCGLSFTRRFVIVKAKPAGFRRCKKCFKLTDAGESS